MSKTQEELWSRFWVTNYEDKYFDESDILSLKYNYSDLDLIFGVLELGFSYDNNDLAQVVIVKPGDILRKLSPKSKPVDDGWLYAYGGKKATKWIAAGANYELVFAKTSELLSGSGWVGNFWLVDGYFFSFADGFSTMAGVLFKKDDQDRPIMQILVGERAYEIYQEKIKQHQWDAINRRLI
jgi:hypothetical protein